MFDSLHHHEHHSSVTRTVTEKRAPTDESVRLLAEFEAAAAKKLQDAIRVKDNHFECVIHQHFDAYNAEDIIAVTFSLNGKRCLAKVRLCMDSEHDGLEKLVNAVAREIALQILSPALKPQLVGRLLRK